MSLFDLLNLEYTDTYGKVSPGLSLSDSKVFILIVDSLFEV